MQENDGMKVIGHEHESAQLYTGAKFRCAQPLTQCNPSEYIVLDAIVTNGAEQMTAPMRAHRQEVDSWGRVIKRLHADRFAFRERHHVILARIAGGV